MSTPSILFYFFQTSDGPFLCSYPGCGVSIKRKGDFTCHMKKHLGIYRYYCPYCVKGIHNTSMLKDHIRIHHTGKHGYHCVHCNKELHNVRLLKQHLEESNCRSVEQTWHFPLNWFVMKTCLLDLNLYLLYSCLLATANVCNVMNIWYVMSH